jgi:outer membrane lipoprotein-sorting protein
MTAGFTQTDARGRSLSGRLTIKRPGRIRFDYGRAANMLIVGDGRALTFLDYSVNQQQRWPINDSPLSVLLNPNQDLARLILQGWNTVDAQNNRTSVSLAGQRFNVPVADSAFTYRPIQRRGPRR